MVVMIAFYRIGPNQFVICYYCSATFVVSSPTHSYLLAIVYIRMPRFQSNIWGHVVFLSSLRYWDSHGK